MAATRQRKTSAEPRQYWQAHNEAYRKSGQTRAAYCEQHKLSLKTFAYWRNKLKADSSIVKLVQIASPMTQTTAVLRSRPAEGFDKIASFKRLILFLPIRQNPRHRTPCFFCLLRA